MLDIQGTTITLTRGDTAWLTVPITRVEGKQSTSYELQPGDRLRLTAKRDYYDTQPVLQLEAEADRFHFRPQDSKALEFGAYRYDIELETATGDVYTVIPDATLIIDKEVG